MKLIGSYDPDAMRIDAPAADEKPVYFAADVYGDRKKIFRVAR